MRARLTRDHWVAISLALFAFAISLWLTIQQAQSAIDDALYYFKIAEHLARGHGSTFDGVHATNGYHPLWAFLLIPIFSSLPPDESARSLATLWQGTLFAASAAFFYASARVRLGRASSSLGTLIWILFAYHMSASGTEFALHALVLSLIAFLYARWFNVIPSKARGHVASMHNKIPRFAPNDNPYLEYLTLGIFLCILFLARVDTVPLAFSVGLFLLIGEKQRAWGRASLGRIMLFALPLMIVVAGYLIANFLIFGYPVPISGIVKRAWSDYYLTQSTTFQTQGWLAEKIELALLPLRAVAELHHLYEIIFPLYLAVGSYGAVLLFAVARFAQRGLYAHLRPLAPFILYSALNLLGYVVLFEGSLVFLPWYFVVQPWLGALLGAILLDTLAARARTALSRRAVFIARLGLGLGIAAYIVRAIGFPTLPPRESRPMDPLEKAARWLDTHTPADVTVASWNGGLMSYYSKRRVINLDGLVNSRDFFERGQFDLCRYWEENRVDLIADIFVEQFAQSPVPSYPFYKRCADQMELIWSDDDSAGPRRVKIYRLRRQ